jgi:hypothetical protein
MADLPFWVPLFAIQRPEHFVKHLCGKLFSSCFPLPVFFLAGVWPGIVTAIQADPLAQYLLHGIEASRSGLVSGHYVADVTREWIGDSQSSSGNDPVRTVPQNYQYRIRVAFDYSTQTFRVDREHPDFERTDFSVGKNVGQYIRTPSKMITLQPTDSTIAIHGIHKPTPNWVSDFDVRALGMGFYGDLIAGKSWDWIWGHIRSCQPEKTNKLDNGLNELTLVSNSSPANWRRFIIDEKRGFWPLEMKNERHSSQLELKEVDGVWVPVTCVAIGDQFRLTIRLDWKTVNRPLDERLFDYHSFASMPGTKVYDRRLGPGQSVLVEILGHQGSEFVPESKWARNLLWGGGAGLLALCSYSFYRRRMKRKKD